MCHMSRRLSMSGFGAVRRCYRPHPSHLGSKHDRGVIRGPISRTAPVDAIGRGRDDVCHSLQWVQSLLKCMPCRLATRSRRDAHFCKWYWEALLRRLAHSTLGLLRWRSTGPFSYPTLSQVLRGEGPTGALICFPFLSRCIC